MTIKKPIKGIFFDIGWTIAYPAAGDYWTLPESLFDRVDKGIFEGLPEERKKTAFEKAMKYLETNHLIFNTDEEFEQFISYYRILSDEWPELNITERDIRDCA
jgi:putative hydrolase of the HAD superfamily